PRSTPGRWNSSPWKLACCERWTRTNSCCTISPSLNSSPEGLSASRLSCIGNIQTVACSPPTHLSPWLKALTSLCPLGNGSSGQLVNNSGHGKQLDSPSFE